MGVCLGNPGNGLDGSCPAVSCRVGSFTETAPRIAAARLVMMDRAGRWVTEQIGRHKRSVTELAGELSCDWHTINGTAMAYGTPLVEDPGRIGDIEALGLDETLFARLGRWRTQQRSTSVVDVRRDGPLVACPRARPLNG
jgi:transposase